ncbi:hypothetical protein CPter291_2417 [Collimonas pratensis]|uniref:Uncharacterized protein n=1 Tax=Collimonas pratensis TaxID=279113 RepID=A0ABM5Z732_9BURK|nr:hypothetical protein CPter291_2417 [Collimonas pratensis]
MFANPFIVLFNLVKQAAILRLDFPQQLASPLPHGIFQIPMIFQRVKHASGETVEKMQLIQVAANALPILTKNGIESQALHESRSAGRFVQIERA